MLAPLLAHGNLGYWDELVFVSVAIIFIGMMAVSWWRSRQMDAELNEAAPPAAGSSDQPAVVGEGRFELD